MVYYLTYSENTYTIREPDSDDDWDSGEYGVTVYPERLFRNNPKCAHEKIEKDDYEPKFMQVDDIPEGEIAKIVLVKYFDGDTFGSSGYWTVVGVVLSQDDAEELEMKCKSAGGYDCPWTGYFAYLDEIEIIDMLVEE